MARILWLLVIALVLVWLFGLLLRIASGLINLLLLIAVIIVAYNLLVGRRTP